MFPIAWRNRSIFTVMSLLSVCLFFVLLISSDNDFSPRRIRAGALGQFTFFALGDFGGIKWKPYSTRTQRQVAAVMAKEAEVLHVSVILGLGDNFYPHGVKNVDDPRFKTTFEDVYSSPSLMRARWLMVAGNHDYEGNITAQLEYSKKSHRWYFPSLYYTKVYRISPTSPEVIQIVVIDTKLLCTKPTENQKPTKRNSPAPTRNQHRRWVEKTLTNSRARYLIVAGHNPIFSVGVHGGCPCLLSFLKPLLDEHKVTAYISGHDHNFQHFKEMDKNVNYFVSGNGNYHDNGDSKKHRLFRHSLRMIYGSTGGYTMFSANSSLLQVTHFNTKGNAIYSIYILPRRTL